MPVTDSAALRVAIQAAEPSTVIGLDDTSYSVDTLAKKSSYSPGPTVEVSGYTIQGATSSDILDTRIYQQNVDGPNSPGLIKDVSLNYMMGGYSDGGALLSATTGSFYLDNVSLGGENTGWDGNGNLYFSLASFNPAAPITVGLTLDNVNVDIYGQTGFDATTGIGGSAFLHSWNNVGPVNILNSTFDEAGFASFLDLRTTGGGSPLGTYTLTGNTFLRSSSQTNRAAGNRFENVNATLTSNTFKDGSFLDLNGNISGITLDSNTFESISNGCAIRVTAPNPGTLPTLAGTNVFEGQGLALKYMNAAPGTGITLSGSVTVNGTSFSTLSAGGQGNDTLTGTAGADWINGDSGADSINGAAGNDYIIGGIGNDTIIGGTGVDTMVGGTGSDVYATGQVGDSAAATATTLSGTISAGQTLTFGNGVDYITDFNRANGQDKLDVVTAGAPTNLLGINSATALVNGTSYVLYGSWSSGTFTAASAWSSPANNDALVVVGDGSLTASSTTGYVLLENLAGSLQAGNFI